VSSGRLRILEVLDKPPDGGGVAVHVARLMAWLSARGHETVELRLVERPAAPPAGQPGLRTLPATYGLAQGLRIASALDAILRDVRPSLVHLHGCFTTLSPVLIARLRRRAPVVGTLHDIRPFCYVMTRRFAPTGRACERRCGAGCFASGCVRPEGPVDVLRLARRWAMDGASLRAWRSLERVLVPSDYLRDLALLHGFAPARLRVVPHGTRLVEPATHGAAVEPPCILYLGNLYDYKGPDLLVEALARLREKRWQAVFAGEGPLRAALERAVAAHGLADRVRFTGHVAERAEVDRLIARARCLVVPSVVPESFGMAGLEALAAGVPVVSFGLGGVRQWLADGETGLIASDRDAGDLARQIARLLDSPALARTLGGRGRSRVAAKFAEEAAFERTEAVYRETAGPRAAASASR